MSNTPLVSVVMAVHNTERYVAEAIESILNQTFQDFELIIVDDGSRDRSRKILQSFARRDDRIRLILQPHQGIPKTRNRLISEAKGELIAVMDSDDVALPERLQRQVDFLQQHRDVVCVGAAQDWVDEAGRFLFFTQSQPEADAEIQQLMLNGRTSINNPSALMRRAAIVQVGGYDESFPQAEDLDLFLKLGEIGKLANLQETLIQYRYHNRSISGQHQMRELEIRRQVCENAWQRRGIEGHFLEDKPWRPCDRPSFHAYWLRYGWLFFNTRQRRAAIAYGWRAVQELPWKVNGWRLLLSALVKPLPEVQP
jgi:glycosyltransferase involved in cell wall biosynthesis